jgi:hypothetical protein
MTFGLGWIPPRSMFVCPRLFVCLGTDFATRSLSYTKFLRNLFQNNFWILIRHRDLSMTGEQGYLLCGFMSCNYLSSFSYFFFAKSRFSPQTGNVLTELPWSLRKVKYIINPRVSETSLDGFQSRIRCQRNKVSCNRRYPCGCSQDEVCSVNDVIVFEFLHASQPAACSALFRQQIYPLQDFLSAQLSSRRTSKLRNLSYDEPT